MLYTKNKRVVSQSRASFDFHFRKSIYLLTIIYRNIVGFPTMWGTGFTRYFVCKGSAFIAYMQ